MSNCPVKFIWHGEGLGKIFMIVAMSGVFLAIGSMFFNVLVAKTTVPINMVLSGACFLWIIGKGIYVYQNQKSGAQKRTRTSTKKIFTRT
jgi:hypothetical protein